MNRHAFFNVERLQAFDAGEFQRRSPFPWQSFGGLLTDEVFARLLAEFPSPALFAQHQDRNRVHGQRPHNRLYLTLEDRLFANREQSGRIRGGDLNPAWREFLEALRRNPHYRRLVAMALGTSNYRLRFDWHLAGSGQDVSPHCDDSAKAGTHLFYFNSSADWRPEWGGNTVLLGGKRTDRLNPELADFDERLSAPMLDNHSTLFRNSSAAWHGVGRIDCPPDSYRRLFCVVFLHATPWRARLLRPWRARSHA
jgi:hypothetical protein